MHQLQYARVFGHTLEDALAELAEHVERFGDRRCEFRWEVARLPSGEVLVRELDPRDLEDLPEGERGRAAEQHAEDRKRALTLWADPEAWQRHAWLASLAELDLGVPSMFGTAEEFERAHAELAAMPVAELPRWFLGRAYETLRPLYENCSWDVESFADCSASGRRRVLADALEAVFLDMANASDLGRPPAVPYRPRQHPGDWPAHLVGEARPPEETVYLCVDMRL